jgi:hypothetical protein
VYRSGQDTAGSENNLIPDFYKHSDEHLVLEDPGSYRSVKKTKVSFRIPLRVDRQIVIIIYLLTAIGLSPGGSTHLHTNNTQNKTNNNRTTQITNNVEECGPCPIFASFYPGICLTTEEKARKIHSQGKRNFSQVNKNLSQSTVYILPRHPHITKLPTLRKLPNQIVQNKAGTRLGCRTLKRETVRCTETSLHISQAG